MGSSNSTEIGVLGTVESGETPLWKQYIFVCNSFRAVFCLFSNAMVFGRQLKQFWRYIYQIYTNICIHLLQAEQS